MLSTEFVSIKQLFQVNSINKSKMKFSTVFACALVTLIASVSANVANVQNTNVRVSEVAKDILNDADLHNAAENANVDALSHIASVGGDSFNGDSRGQGEDEQDDEI